MNNNKIEKRNVSFGSFKFLDTHSQEALLAVSEMLPILPLVSTNILVYIHQSGHCRVTPVHNFGLTTHVANIYKWQATCITYAHPQHLYRVESTQLLISGRRKKNGIGTGISIDEEPDHLEYVQHADCILKCHFRQHIHELT